jgi:hypothetical protein
MYTELWNLCAGPLVTVPKVGDKVYYFPQGHIEQVSTNQPRCRCSWGILCRRVEFSVRRVVSRSPESCCFTLLRGIRSLCE